MMYVDTVVLIVLKTVTLVCGAILTWLTYKTYRRTGAAPMRALWLGMGCITTGTLLAGSAHQLLTFPIIKSSIVQSLFTTVGFVMLIYSLYTEQPIAN
ncbi:hypothetical protein Har1130_17415 [Haloarcula sp. CBA1130]|nr:hypothetical protein Har1130_17415 [Haloarcula sp. CBA1130]KAA9400014.1 hypothetical protein Har1129_05390 [Haloarcula sp. CBA1129]